MSATSRFIMGIMGLGGGYALAYYGINVLVWAHSDSNPANDPVPLSHLLGFKNPPDPKNPFMPPFRLGASIPGSITDARGLLGGTATTGSFSLPSATLPLSLGNSYSDQSDGAESVPGMVGTVTSVTNTGGAATASRPAAGTISSKSLSGASSSGSGKSASNGGYGPSPFSGLKGYQFSGTAR